MKKSPPYENEKIFYIQPLLAGYRMPMVEELAKNHKLHVFCDNSNSEQQGFMAISSGTFDITHAPIKSIYKNSLFFQKNILFKLIKEKPNSVIFFANPRFLSFWLCMITCKLLRIIFLSHGQGLYSHPSPSKIRSLLYLTICKLSTKYICYTNHSRDTMLNIGCPPEKLVTVPNTLALESTVTPDEKSYDESGVLFIGRLREDCRIDMLVNAINISRVENKEMQLHIVGSGDLEKHYKEHYKDLAWIHWYGSIHDHKRIAEISTKCRIGCYPGDAGLSIVHMLGLSLPPLIHSNIEMHMGPEPGYIIDGNNGFFFERHNTAAEIANHLNSIWDKTQENIRSIGSNSYRKYLELETPSMGEQFLTLLKNVQQ